MVLDHYTGFEGEVFGREQSGKVARKEELGSVIKMLTVERMVRGQKRKIGVNVVRAPERFPCGGRRSGH